MAKGLQKENLGTTNASWPPLGSWNAIKSIGRDDTTLRHSMR